jgi:hypothetical protein
MWWWSSSNKEWPGNTDVISSPAMALKSEHLPAHLVYFGGSGVVDPGEGSKVQALHQTGDKV